MRKNLLLTSALLAAVGLSSCSNEDFPGQSDSAVATDGQLITFALRTPAGEKMSYTRALHDDAEFAVRSLQLYEYEVAENEGEKTTSLCRIMSYPTGTGKNVIDLKDLGDGS